jgi:5-methyltetrahydrofolate--homocysteine methyltransferase
MTDLKVIYEGVVNGDNQIVNELILSAMAEKFNPAQVLNEALIPAMAEVGRRMKKGEFYVPEVLWSARTMQMGLDILKPYLVAKGVKPIGTAVIGTVQGDLHDIGKNIVKTMLIGAGFNVIDLGVDVPAAMFVSAVRENKADVVCLSALLTTTMTQMSVINDALKEAGLRDQIILLVGGAPLNQSSADSIGADGYAEDAGGAAEKAVDGMGKLNKRRAE